LFTFKRASNLASTRRLYKWNWPGWHMAGAISILTECFIPEPHTTQVTDGVGQLDKASPQQFPTLLSGTSEISEIKI